MVTALFDLIGRQPVDFAKVRKVRIALSEGAFKMHGGFGTYKAKFEALLSAHYTAAAILHDKALTLAQFEPDRYDDQKLRRFAAERVEARADGSVSGSQAYVEVETSDGATLSARCEHPLGSYENPLSRRQIENKFTTYAKEVLSDTEIANVISSVNGLEHLASVRSLMNHLRGAPRAIAAE
jgi:2-methylcitrate dehydratase PrpD